MISEIGNTLLYFTLGLCLIQIFPANKLNTQLVSLLFISVLSSFLCLVYSHVISDFSISNVYQNSHTLKPLIYKISGTWGNHEGSMLMIVLVMASYSLCFCAFSNCKEEVKNITLSVQGVITAGFVLFIILTSNPFDPIYPKPIEGMGLNPLLQDIGLAIHPPILYIGYIGFSISFSYTIAGLLLEKIDKEWVFYLKSWIGFSLAFLTLGIGLGSWWAYRELGWGGYWFWDPVENVSLMPWLIAVALFHCVLVAQKRKTLYAWTCLLAIITFCLSLTGIFLVRSGILTSVHSFASDPNRGMYMLAFISVVVVFSLLLFSIKSYKIQTNSKFELVSKEGTILLNNFLLVISCMTVMLGTLYPIILEVLGSDSVSVGAPYFNITVVPMLLALLALSAIGPVLKWKEDSFSRNKNIFLMSAFICIFIIFVILVLFRGESLLSYAGILFSLWLICVSVLHLYFQSDRFSKKLPNSIYSRFVSHSGLAILALGISISSGWDITKEDILQKGQVIVIGDYSAKLDDVLIGAGENYITRQAVFFLTKASKDLGILKPEVRHYPSSKINTTEAAIYYSILSNIYIAIGDVDDKGASAVRIYYKPFVNLIWLGCFMLFCGTIPSLVSRRKRLT